MPALKARSAFNLSWPRPAIAMMVGSINDIRRRGFCGFVSISALQTSKCREVPEEPGVYLVLRPSWAEPAFLRKSTGGGFKGKDPTVPIAQLQSAWVKKALVLYIGKAGGQGKKATLKSRLRKYMECGEGKAGRRRGGRLIWQLGDSGSSIVCWKPMTEGDPKAFERGLIKEFKAIYDQRPFANLIG